MALNYLTVQDVLWINLQITEKVNDFNFATLEEATFYQYGYGESRNLVSQAARFLVGFAKKSPISEGSEATGFIALVAFLAMNGREVQVPDDKAHHWYAEAKMSVEAAQAAILKDTNEVDAGHGDHHSEPPAVKDAILAALRAYPKTVAALSAAPVA
jgi:prophage maintenance system killer protein